MEDVKEDFFIARIRRYLDRLKEINVYDYDNDELKEIYNLYKDYTAVPFMFDDEEVEIIEDLLRDIEMKITQEFFESLEG